MMLGKSEATSEPDGEPTAAGELPDWLTALRPPDEEPAPASEPPARKVGAPSAPRPSAPAPPAPAPPAPALSAPPPPAPAAARAETVHSLLSEEDLPDWLRSFGAGPSQPASPRPVASAPVASAPVASAPVASAPVVSAPVVSAPAAPTPAAANPVPVWARVGSKAPAAPATPAATDDVPTVWMPRVARPATDLTDKAAIFASLSRAAAGEAPLDGSAPARRSSQGSSQGRSSRMVWFWLVLVVLVVIAAAAVVATVGLPGLPR